MINSIELIKKSFSKLVEQPVILLPFLFKLVAEFLIAIPLIAAGAAAAIQQQFTFIYIYGAAFVIASLFIQAYFSAGAIGMAAESLRRKTRLKTMCSYGKRFMFRYLGLALLVGFALLLLLALLSLPALLSKSWSLLIIPAIAAIPTAFLLLFLVPAPFCLVTQNLGIFDALRRSWQIAKANYLHLLLLVVLFIVASFIASLTGVIPIAGPIISLIIRSLILMPALFVALVLFVFLSKKQK